MDQKIDQEYQGHVLFMPDGNRRYAKREDISYAEAYKKGAESLKLFIDFFLKEKKFKELTVHFMSKYTHNRTDGTLEPIYKALAKCFNDIKEENLIEKNNFQFIAIDHSRKLPDYLSTITSELIRKGQKNNGQIIRVLLGYDLETDENIAYNESSNYKGFKNNLLIPEIDLVIRTTEMRISGGPIYAMSQSQLITSQKLNPEIDHDELDMIWDSYDGLLKYRKTTNPIHCKEW